MSLTKLLSWRLFLGWADRLTIDFCNYCFARGQSEKTCFIDADDSTTRATSRFYTWRDRVRRITHPDGNSLEYTWDDHLRMTAEKLDGDTEKYEYDYCLCGALKRQRYVYTDSLAHSQTMDWTWTTDKLGRAKKLYHPYEIAVNSGDKYYSLLWEYDKAGRRTAYSDPTYGHTAADTSGWTNHTEPSDETDWVFGEPERYLYGETGSLSAMGRVAGAEVRAGDGEPYFVKRDAAGRVASVIYPNKSDTEKPEYELKYTYTNDGQLAQVATVYMGNASSGTYGPQTFVVQYFYDDAGRLVKKVVRNNEFSEATQYETSYEFDGMGRMVREKIAVYDTTSNMMQVLQDKRTTYDLGGNATEMKFYDNSGWAFTEARTYARGYQLTGFSTTNAAGVTVISGGSYTYDTNNNLTGTKSLNVRRDATQLEYRAQWTFTYDRKNRLKSFTNTNASYVRGNLWYDGQGRVWQRWNDNSSTEDWDATLTRYVYNGALAQEHEFSVSQQIGSWIYVYTELTRDYLRQPAGIRQRERSGGNDTDYYMLLDGARLEGKAEREAASSALAGREERSASLNQISGRTFENISNLATTSNFVEMYGGGTAGATAGFDGLVQRGGRHYLAGVERFVSRMGNNPYGSIPSLVPDTQPAIPPSKGDFIGGIEAGPGDIAPPIYGTLPYTGGQAPTPLKPREPCEDCCWEWAVPNCYFQYGKTTECWEGMCCCPGSRIGTPCMAEKLSGIVSDNYNCWESCCKPSDRNNYGQTVPGNCGGFPNNWSNIKGQNIQYEVGRDGTQTAKDAEYILQRDKIVELITNMCNKISERGCFSACSNIFCDCFRNFCNTSVAPIIYVSVDGTPEYHSSGNSIHINADTTWLTLLHEISHFCMGIYGLINTEARAYACERLCAGSEWSPDYDLADSLRRYRNVHPCCCQHPMPDYCDKYNYWEFYGSVIAAPFSCRSIE